MQKYKRVGKETTKVEIEGIREDRTVVETRGGEEVNMLNRNLAKGRLIMS